MYLGNSHMYYIDTNDEEVGRMLYVKIRRINLSARLYLLAALMFSSTFSSVFFSTPADAAVGSVNQYVPGTGHVISGIGLGSDGNIWYTSYAPATTTRVGKITPSGSYTEYLNRTIGSRYPTNITTGSDGNIWYSEFNSSGGSRIVKLSTAGVVLDQYTITNTSYVAESMVVGPGGDLWFAYNGMIGRISTLGVMNFYPTPWGVGKIHTVTHGPDGNIWYAAYKTSSSNSHSVGKISSSGVYTNYPFTSASGYYAEDITAGPDGNLWVPVPNKNSVLKVTTNGSLTEYSVGIGTRPYAITAATDGNLWYAGSAKVGMITTSGIYTNFTATQINSSDSTKIVSGVDGAVWIYTSTQYGNVFRVAVELINQQINFTSTAPTDAVIDGRTYTPTASATSGLPVTITVDPSSSAICSIDGSGVVSFQGVGTCTLNANQSGDADYKPATQVQQTFNVLPVDADTSISMDCPPNAAGGTTVTCTITVSNSGPAHASDANLVVVLPESLTDITLSGGGILTGRQITWSSASFAPQDSKTLTLSGTVLSTNSGKLRLNGALLQTNPDSNISNNIADKIIFVN